MLLSCHLQVPFCDRCGVFTDSSRQENVRHAIEAHLLDQSSAVRDAAVELIGKYMIDSPEVASHYYPKIAERIAVCRVFHVVESLY